MKIELGFVKEGMQHWLPRHAAINSLTVTISCCCNMLRHAAYRWCLMGTSVRRMHKGLHMCTLSSGSTGRLLPAVINMTSGRHRANHRRYVCMHPHCLLMTKTNETLNAAPGGSWLSVLVDIAGYYTYVWPWLG